MWPFRQIDPVRGLHDDVQVVADHQHGAADLAPQLGDQRVERGGGRLVEPLRRLVQQQDVGLGSAAPAPAAPAGTARPTGPTSGRSWTPRARSAPAPPRSRARSRRRGRPRKRPAGDRQRRVQVAAAAAHSRGAAPARAATRPAAGRTAPISTRSSVVLPEPFGPTMVTISPRATARSTSCSTRRPPSEAATPSAAIRLMAPSPRRPGTGPRPRPWCARCGSRARRRCCPARAALGRVRLGDGAAGAADHEGRPMPALRAGAGDEGVEPLDPVREAVRHEEIERPVGDRRMRPAPRPPCAPARRRRPSPGAAPAGSPAPGGAARSGAGPRSAQSASTASTALAMQPAMVVRCEGVRHAATLSCPGHAPCLMIRYNIRRTSRARRKPGEIAMNRSAVALTRALAACPAVRRAAPRGDGHPARPLAGRPRHAGRRRAGADPAAGRLAARLRDAPVRGGGAGRCRPRRLDGPGADALAGPRHRLAGADAASLALLDATARPCWRSARARPSSMTSAARPTEHRGASAATPAAGHDHGGTDPHAWLDPENARRLARRDRRRAGRGSTRRTRRPTPATPPRRKPRSSP